MSLHHFWQKNNVLIVVGTGLVFLHWGWYNIKSSPTRQPGRRDEVPEPAIVTYVLNSSSSTADPKNK